VLAYALADLPPAGAGGPAVGDVIAERIVALRHATAAVGAVTFDVRGFDTLIEELILFAAAAAVAHLLRLRRDEAAERDEDVSARSGAAAELRRSDTSAVVQVGGPWLVAPAVLFGLYVVGHGHLTPGGGFQGGVLLVAAPLIGFLAGGLVVVRRVSPETALEAAEGAGAAGFLVLLALTGLAVGGTLLDNVVALGTAGNLLSAGMIPLANVAVGLEVAAAVSLVVSEFAEQSLLVHDEP
jgi:multicomponent Na+:H+ antiporter subunit B